MIKGKEGADVVLQDPLLRQPGVLHAGLSPQALSLLASMLTRFEAYKSERGAWVVSEAGTSVIGIRLRMSTTAAVIG
jgi:hypothetical protein